MGERRFLARRWVQRRYADLLTRATIPLAAERLTHPLVPAAHRPSPREARRLVRRVARISGQMQSATHPLEQLAMVQALARVEPAVDGVVVECGCWKGASTAALSLACELVGRELHVFDTFAGLPAVDPVDRRHVLLDRPEVHTYAEGMFAGSEAEVRANVERLGRPERVSYHAGRVEDTLPGFERPVAMAFVDLDLRVGVEACVLALWPRMHDGAALFVHEAPHHEIASLFYDDAWWRQRLGVPAPGLAGAGSGLGLVLTDGTWRSSIGFTVKTPVVADFFVRPPVDVA
jgi:Methyltransferase domain